MKNAFLLRVEALIEASKKLEYPYGGTSPESYVARQAYQAGAKSQKAYSIEEVRYMAACEAAKEEGA